MLYDVLFSSSHRGSLIVNQTSGVEAFARWTAHRALAGAVHTAVIIRESG
jgi:hypothetical protein